MSCGSGLLLSQDLPESLHCEVDGINLHEEEVRVHVGGQVAQELAHVLDGHKLQQVSLEQLQNSCKAVKILKAFHIGWLCTEESEGGLVREKGPGG